MPRKRYTSEVSLALFAVPDPVTKLPTDRPVALYYRQSTVAQVGNQSTDIQTIDLPAHFKAQGWENIILLDMDQGVSGTKKMEDRPGMRLLLDYILDDKIGAVACQDEDRLFRDASMIEANKFIQICLKARVLVLTPSMVYDFANPVIGKSHIKLFRMRCEQAADYLDYIVRGKLHPAKRRMLLEGRWAGAGTPPGFMVDMQGKGTNPAWRKFVPFEPYAEIVREYFRLFLSHGGRLRETLRQIHEHGPYYPDPEHCKAPTGFKFVPRMKNYGKGYCPGRIGLAELLTNATYIGHWLVNGALVRENNHPAIVDLDIFEQAFNYLSAVTIEGHPNPHFAPNHDNVRTPETTRSAERPLCSNLLVSNDNGTWRNVGTNWVGKLQHYTYAVWGGTFQDTYIWGRKAESVDRAIETILVQKMLATFNTNAWQQELAAFNGEFIKERRRKLAEIKALEATMDNQVKSLDTLSDPTFVLKLQARHKATEAEHLRLTQELKESEDEARQLEAIYAIRDTCGPTAENWPRMMRDEKRIVIRAFIRRVEAEPLDHGSLKLTVYWRDNTVETTELTVAASTFRYWLPSQKEELISMYDSGCSQLEIAQAFPDRTWSQICNQLTRLKGTCAFGGRMLKPIRDHETIEQYVARVGEKTLADMGIVFNQVTTNHIHTPQSFNLTALVFSQKHVLRHIIQPSLQENAGLITVGK